MSLSKVKTELIADGAITQDKLAAGAITQDKLAPNVGASVTNATDVDATDLQDGSVLVYSTSVQKWAATKQLEKQVLNGGQY